MTIETTLEKMRMFPGALTVDMGRENVLHLLPCFPIYKCCVVSGVFRTSIGHYASIIRVR